MSVDAVGCSTGIEAPLPMCRTSDVHESYSVKRGRCCGQHCAVVLEYCIAVGWCEARQCGHYDLLGWHCKPQEPMPTKSDALPQLALEKLKCLSILTIGGHWG